MALNPVKIYAYQGTVFFDGGSRVVDPKPVGTLVASSVEGDRIKIDRTDQETPDGEPRNVFRRMSNTRVLNQDGESLVDDLAYTQAQVIDYLNEQFNKPATAGAVIVGPTQSIGFASDATNTSVLVTDGAAYAKNALRAYASDSGLINVAEHTTDGEDVYVDIYREQLTVGGDTAGDTLATAVNTLNATLAGTALGLGGSTTTTTVTTATAAGTVSVYGSGVSYSAGAGVVRSDGDGRQFDRGFYTNESVNEAGEYFEFTQNTPFTAFQSVGLVLTDDDGTNPHVGDLGTIASGYLAGALVGARFSSNAKYGYTTYGTTYGYDFNSQMNAAASTPSTFRCGIDLSGRAYVVLVASGVVHELVRTTYALPFGTGVSLAGWLTSNGEFDDVANIDVVTLDPSGETRTYYYVESPNDSFDYPLFASEQEAVDEDTDNGGSGSATQRTYIDDSVAGRLWWSPDTGFTQGDTAAPTSTDVVWNIIPTQPDGLFAPSAFTLPDQTVDELSAVNIQVQPVGATGYTTAVTNLPAGLSFDGFTGVTGTAPEVTSDYVANPSDAYTITVTRTNTYGSVSTTFDLTVLNRTAPVTPVAGTTHVAGTTALVDSDTLDEGSAVTLDDTLADGQRFVVPQTWTETYVLPQLQAAGDEVWFGVQASGANLADGADNADFDMALVWSYASATSHLVQFVANGSVVNSVTVNSMTDAVYDFGFELNGTTGYIIYCNVGSINNEPSPADGGQFTFAEATTGMTGPLTFTIMTELTTLDIDLTSFSEITTPAAPSTQTSWSKAIDFSGGSEHAKQAWSEGSLNPLRMGDVSSNIAGPSTPGYTAYGGSVRPWATAVMFQHDGNASSQHIWNQGEGAGSTDDNIYLRIDGTGKLYFGWGRTGELNECHIGSLGTTINTSHWHGVYIAHTGERKSAVNATAANLAACFDIRRMGSNDAPAFSTISANLSTAANWTAGSTGGRMDRSYTGDFTIGGRGANRNFHGKIASMVVTTLRIGQPMPDTTEVEMLLTDPMRWLDDYKIGEPYRRSDQPGDTANFSIGLDAPARATQLWLMGDGTSDNYPSVRNRVKVLDNVYTNLAMQNMVSNDIVNVSIPGLS